MSAFFNNLAGHTNLLDPHEFEANRRGEITETQKQRLNAMLGWAQVFVMAVSVLIVGAVLSILSFSLVFNTRLQVTILLLLFVLWGGFLLYMLFIGRSLWVLWDNGAKFRRDQANRAIRQGQGQLSYSKKGYIFQVNGRNLALPANSAGGLVPGATYRVCYLEESGFLLSAEEAYPATPGQVRAAMSEILAEANRFSLEDLAANHNGEVTPAQRRKALPNVIVGVIFGLIPVFLWILSPSEDASSLPIMGIMLVIFLIGAFIFINAVIDIAISTPQQVQSVGHKKKRASRNTTHYYYVVGGQSFEIKHGAYMALIDGLEYRVYYLPRTKRLIAIEALDSSPGSSPF